MSLSQEILRVSKNFKKPKKYSKLQISESPLRLGIFMTYRKFSRSYKNTGLRKWELIGKSLIKQINLPYKVIRSHLNGLETWKFRKMRVSRWFYDMLFSMLIAGVYSIKPMIAPTLEDIKNKLRSSAGIGGYGMG